MVIRRLLLLIVACAVLGYVSPTVAAPNATTCSLNTLKGTWAGAGVPKLPNGLPYGFAWIYMEYWDGNGNATYMEFDSHGNSNSGWYSGPGKYTVSTDCFVTDTANGAPTFLNPDGSGQVWVNLYPNSGRVIGSNYTTISNFSLPSSAAACSVKTLSGTYATSTLAFNAGIAVGYFSRRSFSANGTYTYIDVIENGTTVSPTMRSGTYTVARDCTAFFYDNGSKTPTFAAILAPNGLQYWWLNITNDGTFAADHATRISPSLVSNASYP
jgi:hypothetical protein